MPVPCDRPAILGWRYERTGRLLANVDRRDSVIAALASRLTSDAAREILEAEGAPALHDRLQRELRGIWHFAGARVCVDSGVRNSSRKKRSLPPRISVRKFWDSDIAAALKVWQRTRRLKRRSDVHYRAALEARKRYVSIVELKEARYREQTMGIWKDDSNMKHTDVWNRFRELRGSISGSCLRSAKDQSVHFGGVSFALDAPGAKARLEEACAWVREFRASSSGLRSWILSMDDVAGAFKLLHNSAASLDGTSRPLILPFLSVVLLWVAPLFQAMAFLGVSIPAWAISVLVSIKKKGTSLLDMDNFRGIHVLSFFRQWYAACCIPELLRVARLRVSQLQQGFIKGRKMCAAYLALYALIEAGRLQDRQIFVVFIDVRKAFPSVCREILWRSMSQLGVDPAVLRALILLYDSSAASIRAPEGYGEPFDIHAGSREGGVESPLLYVLYVAALINALECTDMEDGVPMLHRQRAPALMIADDLALVSYSERDMQRLLDICEVQYDLILSALNFDKTRVVPFESAMSRVYSISSVGSCMASKPGAKLRRYSRKVSFLFKAAELLFAKQYTYLGILFDSKSSPACAWQARDSSAIKALECFKACMTGFFFLSSCKICQLLWSLVFSVYLYGAELWAPFATQSSVHPRAMRWLLGFPGIKVERMHGWVPCDNPEDVALSRALRVIFQAYFEGGLLRDAVSQLLINYINASSARERKATWFGNLLRKVRKVWPSFTACLDAGGISLSGVPFVWIEMTPKNIAIQYINDCSTHACRNRFNTLLSSPPTIRQQDYILHGILATLRARGTDPGKSIFLRFPTVAQYILVDFLKLLSGTGDFARVHAHHFLRARLVDDSKFDIEFPTELRYTCLVCLCKAPICASNIVFPLDTEWHMLFQCCSTSVAREAYRKIVNEQFPSLVLPWAPSLETLVAHTLRAREFPDLLISLMKFVTAAMSAAHKARLELTDARIRSGILSIFRA